MPRQSRQLGPELRARRVVEDDRLHGSGIRRVGAPPDASAVGAGRQGVRGDRRRPGSGPRSRPACERAAQERRARQAERQGVATPRLTPIRRWQGIGRATQTLRGVTAAWIKDQRVKLEDGKITEYQVNLQITFVLEG